MEIKKEDYKEYLTEEYMTAKDAAAMLGIGEDELRALVKKHAIPTHNVAGVFQRLKRKEVEELKIKWRIERQLFPDTDKKTQVLTRPVSTVEKAGLFSKIADFWYFNDFYIFCSVLIILLLYIILSAQ
jgi:excisionase family DNA binding protein